MKRRAHSPAQSLRKMGSVDSRPVGQTDSLNSFPEMRQHLSAAILRASEGVRVSPPPELRACVIEMKSPSIADRRFKGEEILRAAARDSEVQWKAELRTLAGQVSLKDLYPFASRVNWVLFQKLLIDTEYDDPEIALVFRDGANLTGVVEGRPSWEKITKIRPNFAQNCESAANFEESEISLSREDLLSSATSGLNEFLKSIRPSRFDSELLEASEADVAKKCLLGPFDSVHGAAEGAHHVVVSRRFGVEQSDKIRPCDDCLRSNLNKAASVDCKLSLPSIDTLIGSALTMADVFPLEEIVLFKRDHGSAYRQIPIKPSEHSLAVIVFCHPVTKKLLFYRHAALPFGAVASVYWYNRVAQAVTHIARVMFCIPMLSYFDDFFAAVPISQSKQCFQIFGLLNRMIGLDIKTKKDVVPDVQGELLGHIVRLGRPPFAVCIKEERKRALASKAQQILDKGTMSVRIANELAGKLNFALSAAYGKIGRAMAKPIYARTNVSFRRTTSLSKGLVLALEWVRDILPIVPPREFQARHKFAKSILYVDARGAGTVGAVYIPVGGEAPYPVYYSYMETDCLAEHLHPYTTRIHILETVAAYFGMRTFPIHGPCIIYCDNVVQQHTLLKGYSKSSECTKLAHAFWSFCALRGIDPWIERVISKENLADEPSRFAQGIPFLESLGAQFVPPCSEHCLREAFIDARVTL